MSDIRKNKKGKSQDDAKMVEKMVTTKKLIMLISFYTLPVILMKDSAFLGGLL